MATWEERLAAQGAQPAKTWEDRLKNHDFEPAPNPADSGDTLQILNPFGSNFDTGIPIGMNTQNYLAGAGKAFYDLARSAAQKVGGYSFEDAKATAKRDAALMATKAGTAGNITGNLAAMLPAAFIPGAAGYVGGTAIGAASGLMQPATGWFDMAANTGFGGAGGVAGNAVGRGVAATYGLGKSVIQPFFESGRQKMVADTINRFVPDKARALAALAADPGEIIPGSLPNAAEATQLPGVAALAKQVRTGPGTGAQQAFTDRDVANNAARVAAVRDVSGDPGQRAFFESNRDATADQLYAAARANGIDPSKITPALRQTMAELTNNPYIQDAMPTAQRQARADGVDLQSGSLDALHYLKLALDDGIQKGSNPLTSAGSKTLSQMVAAKNNLLGVIDTLSPDYAAARQTFASMSKPIDQMDVGQVLADKLIPAINDFGGNANLRAAGFAQGMRSGDAVAQRVTGMPSATIGDVLEPQQMTTLDALGRDLARSSNATRLAQMPGSDTVNNTISQNILRSTLGPFGLPDSAANNTLLATLLRPAQYVGGLAEPKLMDDLGAALLDPQAFAQALQLAGKQGWLDRAAQGLIKYGAPLGSGASGLLVGPQFAQ